jgi:hypothetical protein
MWGLSTSRPQHCLKIGAQASSGERPSAHGGGGIATAVFSHRHRPEPLSCLLWI